MSLGQNYRNWKLLHRHKTLPFRRQLNMPVVLNNINRSRAALFSGKFILYWFARMSSAIASQMIAVAVGWQIYAITGSVFYLGLVGLAQFLPMFLLTLAVGHAADRYNRRIIVCMSQAVQAAGIAVLAAGSFMGWLNKESILAIVFIFGAARSFEGPTMQALLPGLVPQGIFTRATALSTSSTQTAFIIGPAFGGLLYAAGAGVVYTVSGALIFIACVLGFFIKNVHKPQKHEAADLKSVFAGISFIRHKPQILGAISLDLFAVLLGGATALLPAYARDILKTGPIGLGLLRSAPAAGALLMSLFLSYRPLRRRVGRTMFTAVAIFGIGTILFGISKSFLFSLCSLVLLGAADVISMVVRHSLVQLKTPDKMRGRVSAVNSMFIGTSNQLGEFESGLTAAWFGVVPSVVIGGIGTLAVVTLWVWFFPALVNTDKLEP